MRWRPSIFCQEMAEYSSSPSPSTSAFAVLRSALDFSQFVSEPTRLDTAKSLEGRNAISRPTKGRAVPDSAKEPEPTPQSRR